MKILSRTWMLLLIFTLLGGCSLRGDVDLLEARLRKQEDRQFELEDALKKSRSELNIALQQNDQLSNQLAGNKERILLPEQAESLFRAQGIRIQKWMTGGLNRDNQPGDELLIAVIVPHDADGETVKLPGTIQLRLLDPTMPENGQKIGEWTFPPEENRKHWHQGMIAAGYQFRLPWQQLPHSSKLLLHAVLTTTDGRQFRTSEMIQIEPPRSKIATTPNNVPSEFPISDILPISESSATENKTEDFNPASAFKKPFVPALESFSKQNAKKKNKSLRTINSHPGLRTSDNWTDATIPRLR